jgi:hypothetical protein
MCRTSEMTSVRVQKQMNSWRKELSIIAENGTGSDCDYCYNY